MDAIHRANIMKKDLEINSEHIEVGNRGPEVKLKDLFGPDVKSDYEKKKIQNSGLKMNSLVVKKASLSKNAKVFKRKLNEISEGSHDLSSSLESLQRNYFIRKYYLNR